MKKHACGSGCGCKKSPTDSGQSVWIDPTDYDVLKHGPDYLPRSLTASVRSRLKKALTLPAEVPPEFEAMQSEWKAAFAALAILRAASFLHQTHHWETNGPTFYADHLLFDRLYTETQEGIDALAERLVGASDVGVGAKLQAWLFKFAVDFCSEPLGGSSVSAPTDMMVLVSLQIEVGVLEGLRRAREALERAGKLSSGTANLLDGLADTHETFTYLLGQRLEGMGYSYDRA